MRQIIITLLLIVSSACDSSTTNDDNDESIFEHIHPSARLEIICDNNTDGTCTPYFIEGNISGTITSIIEIDDSYYDYHGIISADITEFSEDSNSDNLMHTMQVEIFYTKPLDLASLQGQSIQIEMKKEMIVFDPYTHIIVTINNEMKPMMVIYDRTYGGGKHVDPQDERLTPSFSLETWHNDVRHNTIYECYIHEYSVLIVQGDMQTEVVPSETANFMVDDEAYLFFLHRHYDGEVIINCDDCCPAAITYSVIQKKYISEE